MLVSKYKYKGLSIGQFVNTERFGRVKIVGLEVINEEYVLIDVSDLKELTIGWHMSNIVLNDTNVKISKDYDIDGKYLFIDRTKILW